MSGGVRRTGRAYALQLLYARDGDASADVAGAASAWADAFELELDADALAFARSLAESATEHAARIDELVAGASKNWRIERMSRVDRNILRLGTCELLASLDVPVKVAINEAVELAKKFGTAESSAFVNGVLDRVAAALGRRPES
ncbi:MAG TPA: transcription antitermination factor NusB [Kofleriaceae bacterium]|jgi:N utilization substance protein B